jgi:hypothetical protein
MVKTFMTKMTQEEMQADTIATNNIVRFQDLLNNETDDSRYRILSQLLVPLHRDYDSLIGVG